MAENEKDVIFESILFPTDLTDASDSAAAYALSVARKYKARLCVVHVVDTSSEAAGFYLPHLSYENLDKEMVAGAEEMLKKYCLKYFKGFKDYETKVLKGEPYKAIAKAVTANKIDLVVMGTHTKGGIDKFFFGSTTERVMRKVSCPVLVISPK